MHATATQNPWKRFALPFVSVALLLACVLMAPVLSIPCAVFLPLVVCPLQISVNPWFAMILPLVPCGGLLWAGADLLLSLCLLSFSYFSLFASLMMSRHKLDLNAAILWHVAAVLLAQSLFWWRVGALVGGPLFPGLADALTQAVAAAPNSNKILFALVQYGFIALPSQAQQTLALLFRDLIFLEPALRTEVLNALHFLFFSTVRQFIPSVLMQLSLILGLFTALHSVQAQLRRHPRPAFVLYRKEGKPQVCGVAFSPTFRSLQFPRPARPYLFFLGIAAMLLRMSGGEVATLASDLMLSAFVTIFALLGAATLVFLLTKDQPRKASGAGLLAAALFALFPTALFLLGLGDQLLGLRMATIKHQEEDE